MPKTKFRFFLDFDSRPNIQNLEFGIWFEDFSYFDVSFYVCGGLLLS